MPESFTVILEVVTVIIDADKGIARPSLDLWMEEDPLSGESKACPWSIPGLTKANPIVWLSFPWVRLVLAEDDRAALRKVTV
jgi:hypothetical protein